jgi:Holliday junction resolvase RusA-like endonuclease
MSGDIKLTMTIYYASRRPDLDETLILDLLQGYVYINDRQVKERHTYWGLDPENPRAEILIEQLPKPEKKPAHRRAKRKDT